MTKEQRDAREVLHLWLAKDTIATGKAAYLKALENGNGAIIKDWADRMFGKVKEHLELSEDPSAPLLNATLEQILEIVRSQK